MEKSNLPNGTMFVRMPYEWETEKMTKVYVKCGELKGREEYSRFVENNALALFGAISKPLGISDTWGISDTFYNENVKKGLFVPITDLREVEVICEERGVNPPPPIDLDKEWLKMHGIAE